MGPHADRSRFEIWKTYKVLIIALSIYVFNGAVLYFSIKTVEFGSQIFNHPSWIFTDNHLATFVQLCADVLRAFTILLSEWATSQLWSKKLLNSSTGGNGGLAELQSLTVFQSVVSVCGVTNHILHNHFTPKSAKAQYVGLVVLALLHQLYSPAIVALVTPTLTRVENSPSSYNYTRLKLME